MSQYPLPAEECQSMEDVRAGVDALDSRLVALLAERFGYMRAAARIKQDRNAVRDEARKQQVITQAVEQGKALGVPADMLAEMWEVLVEASIAYELGEWDAKA